MVASRPPMDRSANQTTVASLLHMGLLVIQAMAHFQTHQIHLFMDQKPLQPTAQYPDPIHTRKINSPTDQLTLQVMAT